MAYAAHKFLQAFQSLHRRPALTLQYTTLFLNRMPHLPPGPPPSPHFTKIAEKFTPRAQLRARTPHAESREFANRPNPLR